MPRIVQVFDLFELPDQLVEFLRVDLFQYPANDTALPLDVEGRLDNAKYYEPEHVAKLRELKAWLDANGRDHSLPLYIWVCW